MFDADTPSARADRAAAQSDGSARFSATYARERAFVLALVRQLGVPADGIEDATQEVFVVLYSHLAELDPGASLRMWLRAVAQRVCSNYRRSCWRRARWLAPGDVLEPDSLPDRTSEPPDAALAARELRRLLSQSIERLSPKKRDIIVLALLERRTAVEIARLMRISPNTASSRLRAARQDCARTLRAAGIAL